MIQKETKIFRGSGINSDDDLDFIGTGDARTRYCLGFINGDYDDLIPRRVPDAMGLTLPNAGAGNVNKIIGIGHDAEHNAAILFVYNEYGTGDHQHALIRVYSDGTQENISSGDAGWGFNDSYPIYNPLVIGSGDDALLAWTDGNVDPKLIHIKNFVDGKYASVTKANSYLHKPAPTEAPTITLGYSATLGYSRIVGNIFQFAYRYVYDTKQRSVLSPWSDLIYDYGDDFFDDATLDVVMNYITVQATVDWTNIEKIEFFVRECDIGSGATGYWKLFDTVTVVTTTATTTFYNDESGTYYDDATMERLNDEVPFKADSMEFIMGNRVILGGYTRGRDQVTPIVTLEQVEVDNGDEDYLSGNMVSTAVISDSSNADFEVRLEYGEENHVVFEIVEETADSFTAESFVVKSDYNYGYDNDSGSGSSSGYSDNNEVIAILKTMIEDGSNITVTPSTKSTGGTTDLLNIAVTNSAGHKVMASLFATTVREKVRSMKENAKAYFAIQYIGEDGRTGRAYVTDDMNIQIVKGIGTGDNVVQCAIGVKYTISHEAPSWATKWRWLYGGSSISQWFYIPVRFISPQTAYDNTGTPDLTRVGALMSLNLSQAAQRLTDKHGYNVQTFDPVVGDYVRLIGHMANQGQAILSDTPTQEMYQITKVEEVSGDTIISFYSSDFTEYYPIVLLEIFRQQEMVDPESLVYYEVGPVMDVVASSYHKCDVPTAFSSVVTKVDQSGAANGVGVIDFGNSYQYPVYWFYTWYNTEPYIYSQMVPVICRGEFMSTYLTKDSQHYGQGRTNYVDINEASRKHTALIYSGTFADTSVTYNELNKFSTGSEKYLNEKYGNVYGLREMGYTLYVFQRSKVTPIDLGRETIEQDGQTLVVSSNVVLGSARPFHEDFGTVYSGSICKYGQRIWFYDPLNASVYQIAQNGITDISRFKMKSFFSELSGDIGATLSGYNFLSFYDIVTEAYVLLFIDNTTSSNNWSLSFYPEINRWGCYENYKYSGGVSLGGNKVFSFDSDGYEHHKAGELYEPAYTDVHFNQPVLIRKKWKSLEVDSRYLYSTGTKPSIWVDTDIPDYIDQNTRVHTGGEQKSFIPNGRYKRVNGKYVAAFLRNYLKKDGDADTNERLYSGDILSGKHITIRLTNTDTTHENPLRAVTVGFQMANKQK